MSAHEHRKNIIKARTILSDGGSSKEGIPDRNNCTVVATAIAFRISYRQAYETAKEQGRKDNEGFWTHKIVKGLKEKGYDSQYIMPRKGLTINSFIKDYYQGRYIAVTNNHAFALINGIIYDMGYNLPLSHIRHIYRVL